MRKKIFILIIGLIILNSCGPEIPTNNEIPNIPELSQTEILYNKDLKQIHLQTFINDNNVECIYVSVDVYYPKSDIVSKTVTLNDSGKNGDQLPYDQYFGITFDADLPDVPLGVMKAIFSAKDSDDNLAEIVADSIIFDFNYAPVIEYIDAPDSVKKPSSGDEYINIHATVSDKNGLDDIQTVYFQVEDNSNPGSWSGAFLLHDDGNEAIHNDAVANDGIYSNILTISSTNSLATNYFRYIAVDYSDEESEAVLDSIVIY
ncbi:MAG: hypothetical protein U9N76_00370 [Candidatus Marinimicrobia bacterium]|nr:hypothetical protein [Candidatus Neomarinimicrobiota bacterium]